MPNSIRETIILNALTRLALVSVANGYQYDMATPKRAEKNIDVRDLPVSSLFPQTEENLKQSGGKETFAMVLRVESHAAIGTANASIIQEKMLADLRKNLTDPANVWSALYDSLVYTEGGPADQPNAEDKTTAVYGLFTVTYQTATGDPYTQL